MTILLYAVEDLYLARLRVHAYLTAEGPHAALSGGWMPVHQFFVQRPEGCRYAVIEMQMEEGAVNQVRVVDFFQTVYQSADRITFRCATPPGETTHTYAEQVAAAIVSTMLRYGCALE